MKKKLKRVRLNYRGKRFDIYLKDCGSFEKFVGLMFSRRENAKALLFNFKKPVKILIHSCFVFYDFLAIWLDEHGKVIEFKRVKPFKFAISPKKSFTKLIEIPLNNNYREIVENVVDTRNI